MPAVCRVGAKARCPRDSHGKNCCANGVSGPATAGSPDVTVNGRTMLRIGDSDVHGRCRGSNIWIVSAGSDQVLINGIPASMLGDATKHCGGKGRRDEARPDVEIG
ncbi:PAAR domain-containing protein [Desulfomicrobium salsuginis]